MRQWWYLPRHAGVLCTDFPPCLSSVGTPQAGGSRAGPWKGGGGCEGGTLPRTVKESELSLHFKLTGWPAGHILQVLTENTVFCTILFSLKTLLQRLFYISIRSETESVSCSVVFDSLQPHGLVAGLLCPWNSPGKNTGVLGHSFLQRIFLTQG